MVLGRRYCVVEQSRTSENKMPCGLGRLFRCSSVAFISLKIIVATGLKLQRAQRRSELPLPKPHNLGENVNEELKKCRMEKSRDGELS